MKNILILFLSLFLTFFFYTFGAIQHEADLSRNFNKTGDAKAWFYEIKCENKK